MPQKHLFHFKVGASMSGPGAICLSCAIQAKTRESALNRLKRLMPRECDIPMTRLDQKRDAEQLGEYLRVYFNSRDIHTRDIDYIETVRNARCD